MQFKVGDKAVYPAHGIGVITGIESRSIAGANKDFYVLQILCSGATLMIPTDNCARAGMREPISTQDVDQIYGVLKQPGKINRSTWNRRFREYNDKLRTGSLMEIAEVLRDLNSLRSDKDLSYGEKKMLDKAKDLIIAEISVACEKSHGEVLGVLDTMLTAN